MRDSVPGGFDSSAQLGNGLVLPTIPVNRLNHDAPQVFAWIKVWGLSGPRQKWDVVLLEPHSAGGTGGMAGSIILLEDRRTTRNSMEMRQQTFVAEELGDSAGCSASP